MRTASQDLRYASRALLASPGFSIVAILSLAIGIGANSAIFSVASALLLRPLPYANADRQVILWNTSPGLGIMTATPRFESRSHAKTARLTKNQIDVLRGLRGFAILVISS